MTPRAPYAMTTLIQEINDVTDATFNPHTPDGLGVFTKVTIAIDDPERLEEVIYQISRIDTRIRQARVTAEHEVTVEFNPANVKWNRTPYGLRHIWEATATPTTAPKKAAKKTTAKKTTKKASTRKQ